MEGGQLILVASAAPAAPNQTHEAGVLSFALELPGGPGRGSAAESQEPELAACLWGDKKELRPAPAERVAAGLLTGVE